MRLRGDSRSQIRTWAEPPSVAVPAVPGDSVSEFKLDSKALKVLHDKDRVEKFRSGKVEIPLPLFEDSVWIDK